MRIAAIEWSEASEEHIARHNVVPAEVEDVVFDRATLVIRYADLYRLYGTTAAGRYLLVVGAPRPANVIYIVTARDMTDVERTRHRKE